MILIFLKKKYYFEYTIKNKFNTRFTHSSIIYKKWYGKVKYKNAYCNKFSKTLPLVVRVEEDSKSFIYGIGYYHYIFEQNEQEYEKFLAYLISPTRYYQHNSLSRAKRGDGTSDRKNSLHSSYCYEPLYPNLFENIRKDDSYSTLTLKIILDFQKGLFDFFCYKILILSENFFKKTFFFKLCQQYRAFKCKLYLLSFSSKPYKVLRGV